MAGATSVEVYGFALWLGSWTAYGVYVLWALLPEAWLQALGITWYPSKYWALAIPTLLVLACIMAVFVYESANMVDMQPHTSMLTVRDGHSRVCRDDQLVAFAVVQPQGPVPPLMHLPATFTSKVLYAHQPPASGL